MQAPLGVGRVRFRLESGKSVWAGRRGRTGPLDVGAKKLGTRTGPLLRALSAAWRDSRGVTGIETGIILIAFTTVSAVFVFGALNLGVFSANQASETANAGLAEPLGSLELKGFVIAKAATTGDAGDVSEILFSVTNGPVGRPVDLHRNETVIKYTDRNQSRLFSSTGSYVFTVTPVGGADSDQFVEKGEVYEIALKNLASTGDLNLSTTTTTTTTSTTTTFTLEIVRPQGAVLQVQRTTPVFLDAFNDLG